MTAFGLWNEDTHTVIPDERSEIRNPAQPLAGGGKIDRTGNSGFEHEVSYKKYYTITKPSGSRLASRFAELGRDDENRGFSIFYETVLIAFLLFVLS